MTTAVEVEYDAALAPARPPVPIRRPITRIDRAAARGLILGAVAVGLALIAQGFLARRLYPGEAALLFAAASLVFVRAASGALAVPAPIAAVPHPEGTRRWLAGRRPHPGLLLLALAVLVNLGGISLFMSKADPNVAWLAYLLSMPVGVAGVYLLDARPSLRAVLRRNGLVVAAVGGLLVLALAMRTYRLGELPFGLWADESMSGLEILKILGDPTRRPIIGDGPSQGLPSYLWYLTAPFLAVLGANEFALRLPTAIAGALGVVAVFLLGRALFGTLVGLIAAGILATMSWHVTFSRIAMNGVHSTALDALSLALLAFALRTGRRSLFALAGLSLGLSQNFYFAARLFVVVAGLYLLHHLVLYRLLWLRQHLIGLLLFALFAGLAASPLVYVALRDPKAFNERAQTVTVFKEVEQAGSYQPLLDNVRKHLLMFNYLGDGNGRHNLPGAPMLERTTAALAVLGLVLALTRARNPSFAAPVIWWLVMLQGGIFSLAFEAPQGYRTIDEVVAVALLAALPIAALAERLIAIGGRARVWLLGRPVPAGTAAATALATVAVGAIGVGNYQRYFVDQANTFAVWAAHATPETLIGRAIASGEAQGKLYFDQVYLEHPTIRFLAPQASPNTRYDAAGVLPFRDDQGATVFLPIEQTFDVQTIRRMYPDATIKEYRGPSNGPVVLYQAMIPPAAVAGVRGSELKVWAGADPAGPPIREAKVQLGELPSSGDPVPGYPPGAATASWRAILAVPEFGRYAFKLDGPSAATLRIDETDLTTGGAEAGVTLAKGNHTLELRAPLAGPTPLQLLWRTPKDAAYAPVPASVLFTSPVTNNGLLGSYFKGPSWSGEPAIQQIDPSLQLRIHLTPLNRPYSVEWRGKVYAPTDGLYRFGTASRDGSWVWIDERMVVENGKGTGEYAEGALNLTAGFHDIRIRFLDQTGNTFINLFWTPPGGSRQALPTELMFPPQGSYPDKVVPPPPPPPPVVQAPLPQAQAGNPPGAPAKPGAAAPKPAGRPSSVQPGIAAGAPPIAGYPLGAPLLVVGGPGRAPGQLDQPRASAVDKAGNLYVADTANKRIQKFAPTGQPLAAWGEGDLIEPLGLVVDSGGRIVVLDSDPGWLKRYSPDGTLIDQFGGPDGKFYHPRALAIDAADNLYIADTGGARIVKYNGKGQEVAVIGERGTGPGQIAEPTGVAVDPMGGVWVADSANSKLLRYRPDGGADVELPLPKANSVNGPHLALTPGGSLVVSDPEGGRLIVLDSGGKVRGVVQSEGVKRPVGITVAPDGRLLVSDVANNQVIVLAPLPEG